MPARFWIRVARRRSLARAPAGARCDGILRRGSKIVLVPHRSYLYTYDVVSDGSYVLSFTNGMWRSW